MEGRVSSVGNVDLAKEGWAMLDVKLVIKGMVNSFGCVAGEKRMSSGTVRWVWM